MFNHTSEQLWLWRLAKQDQSCGYWSRLIICLGSGAISLKTLCQTQVFAWTHVLTDSHEHCHHNHSHTPCQTENDVGLRMSDRRWSKITILLIIHNQLCMSESNSSSCCLHILLRTCYWILILFRALSYDNSKKKTAIYWWN